MPVTDNAKSRKTDVEFHEWIKYFNEEVERKNVLFYCSRVTLLVIKPQILAALRLEFLPPPLQPLDAGIVESFEAHCRRN
jgi:hypothetical protein